jgi:hypothetical protein
LIIVWSIRLGLFLYGRIHKTGNDSRFDGIRNSPTTFAAIWLIQALWISFNALPVYLVNALSPSLQPALGMRDLLAAIGWLTAFTLEVTADRQKKAWKLGKERKEHDEPFINSGLVGGLPLTFVKLTLSSGSLSLAIQTMLERFACGLVSLLSPQAVWLVALTFNAWPLYPLPLHMS